MSWDLYGHKDGEDVELLDNTGSPYSASIPIFGEEKKSTSYGSTDSSIDSGLEFTEDSQDAPHDDRDLQDMQYYDNWLLVSHVLRKSCTHSIKELLSDDRRSSNFLTSINLQAMILGTSILTLPYCVRIAGVWAVVMTALIGAASNVTANLLFDCQYTTSNSYPGLMKRVQMTFVGICKAAMKAYGQYITEIMVYMNLLRSVVVLILLSDLTADILAGHGVVNYDKMLLPVIWSILLLPLVFITRMSLIAWPSFIGLVSYIITLVGIFIIICIDYKSWNFSAIKTTTDLQSIGISFGIIVNSYIVHLNIPSIEGSMEYPQMFKRTSNTSFTINTIIKIVFGITGFLVFQNDTAQLITANIHGYHPLPFVLKLSVLFYTYFSFPGNVFVVFELIDQKFPRYFPIVKPGGLPWLLVSRLLPMLICLVIALMLPKFGLVLSLTGSLRGSMIVFLLPALCFLIPKKKTSSFYFKIVCYLIAVFGALGGIVGLYTSTYALVVSR